MNGVDFPASTVSSGGDFERRIVVRDSRECFGDTFKQSLEVTSNETVSGFFQGGLDNGCTRGDARPSGSSAHVNPS